MGFSTSRLSYSVTHFGTSMRFKELRPVKKVLCGTNAKFAWFTQKKFPLEYEKFDFGLICFNTFVVKQKFFIKQSSD
jgi:hypothetical protein